MLDLAGISVFYEVAALLVLATASGLIGLALRQPRESARGPGPGAAAAGLSG